VAGTQASNEGGGVMGNPYLLDTPAVVSFSGGRTSGFMLWNILQAFGGTLPDDVKVVFCNTGKERPETLDFVERCSQQWGGVPIVWLEYRYEGQAMESPAGAKRKTPGKHTFAVVDYATASRNGEPFEQLIRARNMLPNVMARFCTVELKIRTSNRYVKTLGPEWHAGYTNAIGLRADEPHRVAKLATTNRHNREEPVAPIAKAGHAIEDVMAFWKAQPFDLELQQHEGNCDLCFLKGAGKIRRILAERPDLADWWIRQEAEAVRRGEMRIPSTAFFRKDRPRYRVQLEMAQRAGLFDQIDEPDELGVACHCTD
jgi:3'-phosphoadenosine 5'-phosphosulfate sulfotransferase (PAPS reductase)/FAD synthetase